MNDETTNLDQTDEEIFTPTVSDDEIEAAAGIERGGLAQPQTIYTIYYPVCC